MGGNILQAAVGTDKDKDKGVERSMEVDKGHGEGEGMVRHMEVGSEQQVLVLVH